MYKCAIHKRKRGFPNIIMQISSIFWAEIKELYNANRHNFGTLAFSWGRIETLRIEI